MRKWTKIELYIWLTFINSAILASENEHVFHTGIPLCNNLSSVSYFSTTSAPQVRLGILLRFCLSEDNCGTAFVTTSPLLLPSVNKYQYRSNLQDVLRNATATVFLKHYISNSRYRLPTLFMTCDLWPMTCNLWPAKKPAVTENSLWAECPWSVFSYSCPKFQCLYTFNNLCADCFR